MIAGVSITTLLLVLVAGIGAGFVGYAVGASSLISYPALLAFGIPPVLSTPSNTVSHAAPASAGCCPRARELRARDAVWLSTLASAYGHHRRLAAVGIAREGLQFAVPPLILFSALIIALNPRKKAAARDAVAQALPQSQQRQSAALIANGKANGSLRNDPWWLGWRELRRHLLGIFRCRRYPRPGRSSTSARSARSADQR